MKTRELKLEDGGWQVRSVLKCSSHLPLCFRRPADARPIKSATGPAQYKIWWRFATALLLVVLAANSAAAQTYSIDWHKVSGGGGTSSNGQYSVSGTIGQHDAGGPMSGGNYSLTGGFWSLISVVQTSGAPTLHISSSGNTVTVYWQDVSGWNLVQNGNLTTPIASWSASRSPTLNNGTNYLNVTPPTGDLFFRLKQ